MLLEEQGRFVANQGPELICAVAPDGKFTAEAPDYAGRWVKDCDKDIIARPAPARAALSPGAIRSRLSVLLAGGGGSADPVPAAELVHPHDAVQGRDAGEQRTDQLAARAHQATAGLGIFSKRTSIGRCRANGTGARRCRSGCAKRPAKWKRSAVTTSCWRRISVRGADVWLNAKKANPELVDDLKIHKPYIDAVTYKSPFADDGTHAARAGCDRLLVRLAARCRSRSGDIRTREERSSPSSSRRILSARRSIRRAAGFTASLAISTLLFGEHDSRTLHPFKNCIVLGLMLGEDGQKMSKSKRNYREPNEIFDRYGADALRWYLLRQAAAVDDHSLQRAGDQGQHSRVPAAAVERV